MPFAQQPAARAERGQAGLEGPVAAERSEAKAEAQIDLDTTSFMISFVPPKIRVTRASRHSRAIRYSFM
jgi:hypothetical protein